MIYGMYLSAAGVVSSAYRQDVVANNLANSETSGFKRDLALFMQRPAEAQARAGGAGSRSAMLEKIGGGLLAAPTGIDTSQGEVETTDNPADVAIIGRGYFAVESGGKPYLTRAGNFTLDRGGTLTLGNGSGARVLDKDLKPIVLDPAARFAIDKEGIITQNGKPFAQLAVLDAPADRLAKQGTNLFACADDLRSLRPGGGVVQDKTLERSNVDPAIELNHLMEAQRQLEANANMIRYQDQTLSRLVNDVAKIG